MYSEQAWIIKRAKLSPDKIALIDSDTNVSWTYKQLVLEISKWLTFIDSQNYQKGDRLAVLALNRIELFAILFACGLRGLIYVPLNYRLSEKELAFILKDCKPALLVYDEENAELSRKFNETERLSIQNLSTSMQTVTEKSYHTSIHSAERALKRP